MANSKTAVLVVTGLLVGVVAGSGVGFVVHQPRITQLQSDLCKTETALSASQSEVESLQGQFDRS